MAKDNVKEFKVEVKKGVLSTKEGNQKAFGISVSVSVLEGKTETELLSLNDLSIVDGQKGMFVSYPSRSYKDKEGETRYQSIVFIGEKSPLNKLITDAVLDWFDAQ